MFALRRYSSRKPAGNRWHIDCFRCNTCNTLLDSDANLLLLGDGSLICNNCTYSCSACGNKIEDLAILTGDQAFCASCFKCRNCKRKIENLRYARTSQGIFCMQCHESLMSRRKKKKAGVSRSASAADGSQGTLDKSLPALPPTIPSFSSFADGVDSPMSSTSTPQVERSPPAQNVPFKPPRRDPDTAREGAGAWSFDDFKGPHWPFPNSSTSQLTIAAGTMGLDDGAGADAGDIVPIGLDLNPRTRPSPIMPPRSASIKSSEFPVPPTGNTLSVDTEQHDRAAPQPSSAGSNAQNPTAPTSPNKTRAPPEVPEMSPASDYGPSPTEQQRTPTATSATSPRSASRPDGFQLQEAPKIRRRSSTTRSAKAPNGGPPPSMALAGQTEGTQVLEQGAATTPKSPTGQPSGDVQRGASGSRKSPFPSAGSGDASGQQDASKKTSKSAAIPRKEVPRGDSDTQKQSAPPVADRVPAGTLPRSGSSALGGKQISPPVDADGFEPPPRSSSRPTPGLMSASFRTGEEGDFTAPREAPRPPSSGRFHRQNESSSTLQSDQIEGMATPTFSHGTFDSTAGAGTDDESRGAQDEDGELPGIFRKVSKAVKHGRSHSDKYASASPKTWQRGSRNGSVDISSPLASTQEGQEDSVQLRNKLRFSQQRIAELESEKISLQEQVNGTVDIRQVNTELREKRSTMAFLDTQREMVIRELETMTEQLAKVRESPDQPIDYDRLKSDALRDFARQMQNLKESVGGQIEELMRKKNELTGEISNLIQMKDKGFQEYESLSTKNQSLVEHNRALVENIRGLYNQGRQGAAPAVPTQPPNGLGIYSPALGHKDSLGSATAISMDAGASQLSGDTEVEGPHVVNIRKGGQAKKFSWKRGTENVTKNVKRGFKGAFASSAQAAIREDQFTESLPYGALPEGEAPTIGDRPVGQRNGVDTMRLAAAGGRSVSEASVPTHMKGISSQNSGSSARSPLSSATGTALYGTDLTARCDAENRVVPAIVTRCISEVESRGMDVEGIYRKSGSFSQVKAIQAGFEKDANNFDISDPDLDIHAVTSAMKQYLRKLPVPLISYDCYDELLEATSIADEPSRIKGLTYAVGKLPESHRNTLEILVFHLIRVIQEEKENLVSDSLLTVSLRHN